MSWLFHRNYVGPDRRGGRFEVRFIERRKRGTETAARVALPAIVREFVARGLRWVDTFSYFGPDRRSGAFSHFFLERRRHEAVGPPPPLQAALRQLRVRVLEAEDADGRRALHGRLTATALLATARGREDVADLLLSLADQFERGEVSSSAALQSELLAAEAMLDSPAPRALRSAAL